MKLKHHNNEHPLFGKNLQVLVLAKKSTKILLLFTLSSLIILILIPLFNPFPHFPSLYLQNSSCTIPITTTITTSRHRNVVGSDDSNLIIDNVEEKKNVINIVEEKLQEDKCDLFTGEWIPNPEAQKYNAMCYAIQDHQNCLKYGRPDTEFINWRWKPDGCELPIFNPYEFLEMMRGKSLAFVGDSVARNHVQSLICLLSNVVYPIDVSNTTDQNFRNWEYTDYNFNVSILWSPYLVKTQRSDPNVISKPFNLYLDEYDETWTTKIKNFDYVIISAGQWFFRPSMFYENNSLIGCVYCSEPNVTQHTPSFSYQKAFNTALKAVNSMENYEGTVIVRTFSPSHFEGGLWNESGDCVRTRPFRRDEVTLEDLNLEMHKVQVEEVRIGESEGRSKGVVKLRLMDMTRAMLMRPDGHPSRYGWPVKNMKWPSDCVHWCLPGPIDAWNDFLLEMLRRENTS